MQGLVGLHGGAICIESAPDAGTTVTVSLPTTCRPSESPPIAAPMTVRLRSLNAAPSAGAIVRLPLGLFEMGPVAVRETEDPTRLRRVG